jgi:hypothetical protein
VCPPASIKRRPTHPDRVEVGEPKDRDEEKEVSLVFVSYTICDEGAVVVVFQNIGLTDFAVESIEVREFIAAGDRRGYPKARKHVIESPKGEKAATDDVQRDLGSSGLH